MGSHFKIWSSENSYTTTEIQPSRLETLPGTEQYRQEMESADQRLESCFQQIFHLVRRQNADLLTTEPFTQTPLHRLFQRPARYGINSFTS